MLYTSFTHHCWELDPLDLKDKETQWLGRDKKILFYGRTNINLCGSLTTLTELYSVLLYITYLHMHYFIWCLKEDCSGFRELEI